MVLVAVMVMVVLIRISVAVAVRVGIDEADVIVYHGARARASVVLRSCALIVFTVDDSEDVGVHEWMSEEEDEASMRFT